MWLVGLTGGIGSGKSTVGRLLVDRGAVVIDADKVAREIVERGSSGLAAIVREFGPSILTDQGDLDRPAMASMVFSDPDRLAALEAITHPRIGGRIEARIKAFETLELMGGRERLVVVEHPLLIETGLSANYETVIVVLAGEELRVKRLMERGLTEADARARMAAQASDEERLEAATHLIDNAGDLDDLTDQVDALVLTLGVT